MIAREALELLEAQHGHLTPELVVEAARPDDSELHRYIFDCAPEEAAEKWWLHKAQELIQSVKVRYQTAEGPLEVRRYLSITSDEQGRRVYKKAEDIAIDPFLRELMLREMRRDVEAMRNRYKAFGEFWKLIEQLAT